MNGSITDIYSCIQKCSWRWPTNYMDQSSSWQAKSYSSAQEIHCLLWDQNVTWFSSFFLMMRSTLNLIKPQNCRITPHISVTAYSLYLQLLSVSVVVSSISNLRIRHAVATQLTWFKYSEVLWTLLVYSVHCLYITKKIVCRRIMTNFMLLLWEIFECLYLHTCSRNNVYIEETVNIPPIQSTRQTQKNNKTK